jgi:hypothetical protein
MKGCSTPFFTRRGWRRFYVKTFSPFLNQFRPAKEERMKKSIFIISLALAVAFVLGTPTVQSQPGRGIIEKSLRCH